MACNSATAAALPELEAHLRRTGRDVDVIGVLSPAAQLAVAASRSGRLGLLATAATVSSGAYERTIRAADPHVLLESVACPDLVPVIEAGFPFDQQVVDTVRAYCAPLRAAEVDTVILGCTHYPLVAPMLQRMLGRGVTLVTSGSGVVRSAERALTARGLLNPRPSGKGHRRKMRVLLQQMSQALANAVLVCWALKVRFAGPIWTPAASVRYPLTIAKTGMIAPI